MSTRHIVNKGWIGMMVALAAAGMVTSARGGSLDSPAAPTDPSSAMYTAKDLYDRLASGTNAPKRAGAFTEPTAGPTAGTMPTTDEIMAKAPATNASGAVAGEVLSGKTFWGLTQGAWGTRTGTIATVTLSPTTTVVNAGYYAATTLSAVDTDLAAGNIKKAVNIFGVLGTYEGSGGSAINLPKTGQTNSYVTGDDGDLAKGMAWPNPRFTVQANTNCVLDNLTGLMWARNANLAKGTAWSVNGTCTWYTAFNVITNSAGPINGASYGGYNDWRLPNVHELQSLMDYGAYAPALCNMAGTGQWVENNPFTGVQSGHYWSSTTIAGLPTYAWRVDMYYGDLTRGDGLNKWDTRPYVWPVRGGQ